MMTERAHQAACDTMKAELDAQAAVADDVLDEQAGLLEAIAARYMALFEYSGLVMLGIGDSELVGTLAAEGSPDVRDRCLSLSPLSLSPTALPNNALVVVNSISGWTAITVEAAGWLRAQGHPVVAVCAELDAPLTDVCDHAVVLDIPRFPPDAKVSGTITMTIPVVLLWLLVDLLSGLSVAQALASVRQTVWQAWAREQAWPHWRPPDTQRSRMKVHALADPGSCGPARYLQAKLAESLGITAAVTDPESWMHVLKHAVDEHTLVTDFTLSPASQQLLPAIAAETRRRGGQVLSWRTGSRVPEVDAPLTCEIDVSWSPNRQALLETLFRAQSLTLTLLGSARDWAPYQSHRLTAAEIRGLSTRTFRYAESFGRVDKDRRR